MRMLTIIALLAAPGWTDQCREHEFRCELRCNDSTQGGSMARLKCYARCRAREQECREETPEVLPRQGSLY